MANEGKEAYCTLLLSDGYLPGAMVLAHSLRDNGTTKELAVFVTLDSVSSSTINELKKIYDHIIPVDRIINKSPANLYLMDRPDLISTFTKIALWRQIQFSHLVYLDSDIVALRAPDELFAARQAFAAVPDVGWPDCFNSGVLSLKPNMGDYYALLALAHRGISFDGADQGLLNMHFRDWHRLSFTYNCTPSGNYQYVPAYRHFQSSISMVHYIGHDKPWIIGREYGGANGVYEELLGRWWAVYDKHFRTPTTAYASENTQQQSRTVQQHVTGETSTADYGSSLIRLAPEPPKLEEPKAPIHTTEPSLTDQADTVETIDRGEVKSTPTMEQRWYSVDWDPRHQPPPVNSRPEAANFQHRTYDMSSDRSLFQAPQLPDPPKNMYYEVPPPVSREKRPMPIFPWESKAPKPTRVFAQDLPPPPTPSTAPSIESTGSTNTETDTEDTETETISPATPSMSHTSAEPFEAYTRTNAWDDVPEIERYVASLPQNRRARTQILFNKSQTANSTNEPILSPPTEDVPSPQTQRRPSMKLTDFPTEVERPSLPVTPAPVRRPSFWGAERDEAGDLPAAEGVPEQSEWDPVARLTELQKLQSEVLGKGPAQEGRAIPERKMPESSSNPVAVAQDRKREKVPNAGETTSTSAAAEPAPSTAVTNASESLNLAGGTLPLQETAGGGD